MSLKRPLKASATSQNFKQDIPQGLCLYTTEQKTTVLAKSKNCEMLLSANGRAAMGVLCRSFPTQRTTKMLT